MRALASSADEQRDRKPFRSGALADGRGQEVSNGQIRSAFDLAVATETREEMASFLRRGKVRERAIARMKKSLQEWLSQGRGKK